MTLWSVIITTMKSIETQVFHGFCVSETKEQAIGAAVLEVLKKEPGSSIKSATAEEVPKYLMQAVLKEDEPNEQA